MYYLMNLLKQPAASWQLIILQIMVWAIPSTAMQDATNPALVILPFLTALANAVAYTLIVNGVSDLSGNAINNGTANFSFYTPQQYDVVIDEIMADPTPQVGLPNSEWVELRNTSAFAINLQGWKLADATGPDRLNAQFYFATG